METDGLTADEIQIDIGPEQQRTLRLDVNVHGGFSNSSPFQKLQEEAAWKAVRGDLTVMIWTNLETLSVPVRFGITDEMSGGAVGIAGSAEEEGDEAGSEQPGGASAGCFVYPLDFAVLTRPNLTHRLPIRFKNGGARPVVVLKVAMDAPSSREYMATAMELEFNRSSVVLPLETAQIGAVALRAVPSVNRHGEPMTTSVQLEGSLTVTVEELQFEFGFSKKDGLIGRVPESAAASAVRRCVGSISAWILLGNLNYSFQQSLWWMAPYWWYAMV